MNRCYNDDELTRGTLKKIESLSKYTGTVVSLVGSTVEGMPLDKPRKLNEILKAATDRLWGVEHICFQEATEEEAKFAVMVAEGERIEQMEGENTHIYQVYYICVYLKNDLAGVFFHNDLRISYKLGDEENAYPQISVLIGKQSYMVECKQSTVRYYKVILPPA